ncbi:MAG: hypothetical protein BZY88_16075 [SAR202 cluster bacterium Io17-Chloro-G9]|nr:MAG: hypothetical protein BZY88_16075 [SAR202 cluster bacterium Io17-Chloro-G9]
MNSKTLLLLLVLAVLVAAGLIGYGDFRETFRHLMDFPLTHLFAALALALMNYFLRFVRWALYLKVLNIKIPLAASALVFLSGLAMSITPGKAGEALKSYLLRERTGTPVAASLPVVVMERATDLVSVVLLGMVGLALLPMPVLVILSAALLICGVVLLVLTSKHSQHLANLPLLRRWKSELLSSQESLRLLAAPRVMLAAVILGAAAWFSEGVALWVILLGLDEPLAMDKVLPIYAAATLVGAITTIPGGLGATEGSMVALLQQSGLARDAASAGTLLVRFATLVFAVLLGLAALVLIRRIGPNARSRSPAMET